MNIEGLFQLGLTRLISLNFKGLSRIFPSTTLLQCSVHFMFQHSHLYLTTGKTTGLTIWTFVGSVMSLFSNTLSTFVIAFLPRIKCLWISWLQSPDAVILEPKEIKSSSFHFSSIYLPWSDWTRSHDLSFFGSWVLSQLIHSPLSPSLRGSLVHLSFLSLKWYHQNTGGCWYFSQQSWIQLLSHSAWCFAWCIVHVS